MSVFCLLNSSLSLIKESRDTRSKMHLQLAVLTKLFLIQLVTMCGLLDQLILLEEVLLIHLLSQLAL